MNTQEIWSIAGAIIASVGGAGVVICAVSGFVSARLAHIIDKKYEQKLNEKLERYKLALENSRHITKTQFDKEFEIYHLLSKSYFSMVVMLSSFTQNSLELKEMPKENREMKIDEFMRMGKSVAIAQDTLYENAAFIPQDLFEKYDSIYNKAINLFWIYEGRLKDFAFDRCTIDDLVTDDDKKNMDVITDEFSVLNARLREYLNTLSIVE